VGELLVTLVTVAAAIAAAAAVFFLVNRVVDAAPGRARDAIRPWVFVGPALVFLGVGLVYPLVRTIYLAFRAGPGGEDGFTFDNIRTVFTDDRYFSFNGFADIFTTRMFLFGVVVAALGIAWAFVAQRREEGTSLDLGAPAPTIGLVLGAIAVSFAVFSTLQGTIWNNLWWVVAVTGLSTFLGLLIAILADRSSGENVAKSLIFMPMAISMVGAAVIWRYVYYRNTRREDIGLLNAILTGTGILDEPVDFYTSASLIPWNNFFIMIIMIWIQTGFALIVFSAAIKAVPSDTIEASHIDGASALQTLWRVVIPQVYPTIIVVVTTLVVTVMKVFDLVKATTNGRSRTDVLANTMYENLRDSNFTLSATFALVIFVLVLPVMIYNVRQTAQEA
jgi:ABC-type sugar transport system permease subunit